jgi:hypothetical protein
MRKRSWTSIAIAAVMLAGVSPQATLSQAPKNSDDLVGAWRGKVQLTSGMFAELKDLQYMYVFNAGGTMTESSNYDAVPPVPPAYGVWRRLGPRRFEAKYEFFQSKAVSTSDELIKTGGWGPGGHGVIRQTITLSADGNRFTSKISIDMFDNAGKAIPGGGSGTASGERIRF